MSILIIGLITVLLPLFDLTLLLGEVFASAPGFGASLSQNGLNYAMATAVPLIEKAIPAFTITDFTGNESVPIMGSFL